MGKKIRWYMYGGVLVILILIVVGKITREAKSDSLSEAYTGIVAVRGLIADTTEYTRYIEETGALTGNKESMIATETGGRVKEILVEVGSFVKEGSPLVRIDDELYKLDADRAKIAFDKAKMDYDRLTRLYDQKSISESDLESARLGMKSAEVGYKVTLKTYNEATVRAPFSGTVAAKLTEVGQMVERGVPVVQLVDIGSLKLTIQVAEENFRFIPQGATATVIVDALRDTVQGKVFAIGSRATTGQRTFPVEIRIAGNGKLKSGMFARAVVSGGTVTNGILLPRVAVLPDAGRSVVYLAKNKKAEKQIIRVVGNFGDRIAVEGIARGDTVITVGNQQLSQGSPIALVME